MENQVAVPCIHKYDTEWSSSQPVNDALAMNVFNVCEWVLTHKFRTIMRPKFVNVVFCEIPDEYVDDQGDLMRTVYGYCRPGHTPQEGMSPAEVQINININQSPEMACHTTLHELVHAMQIFKRKLWFSTIGGGTAGQLHMWEGRAFSTRLMPYEELPWEVEAETIAKQWRKEFLEWAVAKAKEAQERAKREAEAAAAQEAEVEPA